MARRTLDVYEKTKRTVPISVVDAAGAAVDLTNMKVYFYIHDLAEGVDDGDNRMEVDSDGAQVTIVTPLTGAITVDILPADIELTEADEDMVEAVWQVRWENSAGADDTDEYSIEQPTLIRRNRVKE